MGWSGECGDLKRGDEQDRLEWSSQGVALIECDRREVVSEPGSTTGKAEWGSYSVSHLMLGVRTPLYPITSCNL